MSFQSAERFRNLKEGVGSPLGKAAKKAFLKIKKREKRKRHKGEQKKRDARLRELKKDPAFRRYLSHGTPAPGLTPRRERYRQYLRSEHWHIFRETVLAKRGRLCQQCKIPSISVDLHHLTYERLGEERESDVEVLCRPCHDIRHGKAKTSPAISGERLTRGQRSGVLATRAKRSPRVKSSTPPQEQAGR